MSLDWAKGVLQGRMDSQMFEGEKNSIPNLQSGVWMLERSKNCCANDMWSDEKEAKMISWTACKSSFAFLWSQTERHVPMLVAGGEWEDDFYTMMHLIIIPFTHCRVRIHVLAIHELIISSFRVLLSLHSFSSAFHHHHPFPRHTIYLISLQTSTYSLTSVC